MLFHQIDIDKYILNAIINSAQIDIPFDFDTLMDNVKGTLPGPPFDGGESLEAHVFAQIHTVNVGGVHTFRQLHSLVQEGYLKKLLDGSGRYILTKKGEEAKKAGSIEEYKAKKRWNNIISKTRDIIITFIFPALTIYFAAIQTCNNKIEIVKPVNVIIDSTLKLNIINHQFINKDTCDKANDSSNIIKANEKPKG